MVSDRLPLQTFLHLEFLVLTVGNSLSKHSMILAQTTTHIRKFAHFAMESRTIRKVQQE